MVVALDEIFEEFKICTIEGLVKPKSFEEMERIRLFGSPRVQGREKIVGRSQRLRVFTTCAEFELGTIAGAVMGGLEEV